MKYTIEVEFEDDNDNGEAIQSSLESLADALDFDLAYPWKIICRNDIGDSVLKLERTQNELDVINSMKTIPLDEEV